MEKKRVLIVTQEMKPYLIQNTIATVVRELSQHVQESDMEIRVLMPRFGVINERRHRLHEVVRLSGINIIIDDDDYPLIIKVASLPGARMQVYFLDNEDFFKRKNVFEDADGKPYEDNAERMIFFCKGVLETVKKFGWPPDIVHCHGWMTSLMPAYLKTAYKKDPIFANSKTVYSVYSNNFEGNLSDNFQHKAQINKVEDGDLDVYMKGSNTDLHLGALHYADGIVQADAEIAPEVLEAAKAKADGFMEYPGEEDYLGAYTSFYTTLLEE